MRWLGGGARASGEGWGWGGGEAKLEVKWWFSRKSKRLITTIRVEIICTIAALTTNKRAATPPTLQKRFTGSASIP